MDEQKKTPGKPQIYQGWHEERRETKRKAYVPGNGASNVILPEEVIKRSRIEQENGSDGGRGAGRTLAEGARLSDQRSEDQERTAFTPRRFRPSAEQGASDTAEGRRRAPAEQRTSDTAEGRRRASAEQNSSGASAGRRRVSAEQNPSGTGRKRVSAEQDATEAVTGGRRASAGQNTTESAEGRRRASAEQNSSGASAGQRRTSAEQNPSAAGRRKTPAEAADRDETAAGRKKTAADPKRGGQPEGTAAGRLPENSGGPAKKTAKRRRQQQNEAKLRMLWILFGILTVALIGAVVYEIVLGNGTKETGAQRMEQQKQEKLMKDSAVVPEKSTGQQDAGTGNEAATESGKVGDEAATESGNAGNEAMTESGKTGDGESSSENVESGGV